MVRLLRTEKKRSDIISQSALPGKSGAGGGAGGGRSGFHLLMQGLITELRQPSHLESSASPKVGSDFANSTQTSDGKWAGP